MGRGLRRSTACGIAAISPGEYMGTNDLRGETHPNGTADSPRFLFFVPREIAEELRDGITLALIVAKGMRSVVGREPEIKTTGDE